MKIFLRTNLFLLFLSVILWAKSETTNEKVKIERVKVAVTLAPYAKILQSVGGERVDVVTLIPVGSEPHSFEPTPANLKDFATVSLYFSDGSGMDKSWMPRFKGVNQNVQVVSLSEGVTWNYSEEHGSHTHGSHEHADLDPHLWTSPQVVKIIAANMANALKKIDPAGDSLYAFNLKNYQNQMDALSAEIRESLQSLPPNQRKFLVFHPVFGYLAREFSLEQLCIEVEGKEPKPKDLANLIRLAKAEKIKTVFVLPAFSRRSAEAIAHSIEGTVVVTNPLAYDFESEIRLFVKSLQKAGN